MTNPITAEVRAALERLRDAKDGNPPWEYAGEDGIEARSDDTELIADAMLALFPEGMPQPVEMRCYLETEEEHEGTGPITHAWAGHSSNPNQNCVGLFFPLRRYEFPADKGFLETQP